MRQLTQPTIASGPACELLEGRSLFTASVAIDTSFAGGAAMLSGGTSYADCGVLLHDGRLLVAGSILQGSHGHNVFALYNANGTLSQSFGSNGKLIETLQQTSTSGLAGEMFALPDDSVLVQFNDGVRRMMPSGTFDASFGSGGVLKADLIDARLQSNGTTLATEFSGSGTRTRTLDTHGKTIALSAVVASGGATVVSSGHVMGVSALWHGSVENDSLTLYSSSNKPIKTFGANGSLSLAAASRAWLTKHGPWYLHTKLGSTPAFNATGVSATRTGGYVVDGYVNARQTASSGVDQITRMTIRLTAGGRVISVNAKDDDRVTTAFSPSFDGTFAGVFHAGHGGDVSASVPGERGHIFQSVADGQGGYYLLGFTYKPSDPLPRTSHFTVVHTLPPEGKITGTLFSDVNLNGHPDAADAAPAGKLVYLDTNGNGQLDPGEDTTTTDATGRYIFADLGPGQYTVRRVFPSGYRATTPTFAITVAVGKTQTFNMGAVRSA